MREGDEKSRSQAEEAAEVEEVAPPGNKS